MEGMAICKCGGVMINTHQTEEKIVEGSEFEDNVVFVEFIPEVKPRFNHGFEVGNKLGRGRPKKVKEEV